MNSAFKSQYKSRSGFTLIELLVVIAIIAILAAILFPVFAKVREKARQISCLSNTKQLALGFVQYEQDFDEKTPNGVNPYGGGQGWAGQIYPYVKSAGVYLCPDDSITPDHSSSSTPPVIPFNVSSYIYNSQVSIVIQPAGTIAPDSVSLAAYNAPASTVLLAECEWSTGYDITRGYQNSTASAAAGDDYPAYFGGSAGGIGIGGAYDPSGFNSNGGTPGGSCCTIKYATGPLLNSLPGAAQGDFTATGRHTGGSNFVMADGHAKFFRPSQVSGGGINTATNGDCGHAGTAATTGCSSVAATYNLL
jgi:prepilin-type N-terminal cleavage/methylation domain-containing protein/prepilin-type processing-associated H-X9-DG protein